MSKDYIQFISRINRKLGIDLSLYKEAQMKRRITSLRNKRGYTDFVSFYRALEEDETLLEEFTKRLTINVSEFYRNPKRWDVLEKEIIPRLIAKKNKLTIWSAACSTGEEPYSISMLLSESFPDIQATIIATDIDEFVLKQAKQGVYQEQSLKNISPYLKKKYFTHENNLYYINKSVKNTITFKKHNLLADHYPENIDLLICRNVLIYFTDQAKEIIYQKFSSSLNEQGILFVGSTEQIFNSDRYNLKLFDTFFYEKNS